MDFISKLGYSRYSPYQNSPFIDIKSPNGLIDMSNTDVPLLGIGLKSRKMKLLPPRSGIHSFPNDEIIREINLNLPKDNKPEDKQFSVNPYTFGFSPEPGVNIFGIGASPSLNLLNTKKDKLALTGDINSVSVGYPGGQELFTKPQYGFGVRYTRNLQSGGLTPYQKGGFFRNLFEGVGDFFRNLFSGKGGRGSFDCPGDVCSPGKIKFERTRDSKFRDKISKLFKRNESGSGDQSFGSNNPRVTHDIGVPSFRENCYDEDGNPTDYYYDENGNLISCDNNMIVQITTRYNNPVGGGNSYTQTPNLPTPPTELGSKIYEDAIVGIPDNRSQIYNEYNMLNPNYENYQNQMQNIGPLYNELNYGPNSNPSPEASLKSNVARRGGSVYNPTNRGLIFLRPRNGARFTYRHKINNNANFVYSQFMA